MTEKVYLITKNVNATCVENQLADRFSGWELDLPKPIDEIEVKISRTKTSTSINCSQIYLKSFNFQISCVSISHCVYETGVDPIPVFQEGEVQISLHLNLLGEPNSVSGPMEIGESIVIQCSDPG